MTSEASPAETARISSDQRPFLAYCLERDTFLRSLKTALLVGTILALINHGQQFLAGQFAPAWIIPMLITYCVPFTVATYGQVQGKRHSDRKHVESQRLTIAALDTVRMQAVRHLQEGEQLPHLPASNASFSLTPLPYTSTVFTRSSGDFIPRGQLAQSLQNDASETFLSGEVADEDVSGSGHPRLAPVLNRMHRVRLKKDS